MPGPDLQQRLARLEAQLEKARQDFHIPGMAMAVVKEDAMIWAKGFGLADIEKETPVTPETIFAIGSSTKAFTVALIAMLVDEGRMGWDDPITRYLPDMQLKIDSAQPDAAVTIRDLLCHRTGFTRMSMLFAGGSASRDEILRTATGAEPWSGFRERFLYNNVMYLAAGQAAGIAVGSDWDTLMRERIFIPLGMSCTHTSVPELSGKETLSLGYDWDEIGEKPRLLEMRVLENIAPAGAINSNVLDMAKWVRFQLNHGVCDSRRLVSEGQFQETWKAQIAVSPGKAYSLGWFLSEWHGQPVVEHGGNIDGFGAQVGLLPDSHIGYVLLTNVTSTPLQPLSLNMVWEALAGEWEEADDQGDTVDYSPYLGTYVANFGPFRDVEFTLLEKDGYLAVDVPGQTVYELKDPDEEGKWRFTLSDQIAVSFVRDDTGRVIAMKQYQNGVVLELPRA
ncbi:MAG: serine hydrolase domain-containing protein, partial [Planctomycetota bacterium]